MSSLHYYKRLLDIFKFPSINYIWLHDSAHLFRVVIFSYPFNYYHKVEGLLIVRDQLPLQVVILQPSGESPGVDILGVQARTTKSLDVDISGT